MISLIIFSVLYDLVMCDKALHVLFISLLSWYIIVLGRLCYIGVGGDSLVFCSCVAVVCERRSSSSLEGWSSELISGLGSFKFVLVFYFCPWLSLVGLFL